VDGFEVVGVCGDDLDVEYVVRFEAVVAEPTGPGSVPP